MTKIFDTVIIGGGHNGLVCATYLAKAGLRVCVLEAADQVGGAAITSALTPKHKVSAGAHYLNQLHPDVMKDMALESHGLSLAATDLKTTTLAPDGNHMTLTRTTAEGAGLSADDKATYTAFMKRMGSFAGALNHLIGLPPINIMEPDWQSKIGMLKLGWNIRLGLGKDAMSEMLRIVGINIFDVLDENFDNDLLKGALAFDAVLGTHMGPRSPGSVLTYLYRIAMGEKGREGAIMLPKGGMGSVTEAMAKAALAAGAEIRTGARVAQVMVDDCRVTGVRLESGEEISARSVASNADPKTTVFGLVGARHFESDFANGIHHTRAHGNAAKLHLALTDLPTFKGLKSSALGGRLLIAPDQKAVERAFNHAKYGEVSSEPMMEIILPTISDPDLAPGGHVLSATVQYAPYKLKGGWTDDARKNFMEACIDRINQFAPDIRALIDHAELLSPADIEARFGMSGGHWHHGEMAIDQMLMLRPTPEAARYALPLDGLYLCGAGAHPGGGVMGAAGKNAAQMILKGART